MSGLPRGWAGATVDNVADIKLGKMLDKAKNKGRPRAYLRNVNVRWDDFNLQDILEMRFTDEELEPFGISDGDVLVCEGGEPGRCAVWRRGPTELKFQKALMRLRPRGGIDSFLLAKMLRFLAQTGELQGKFTGTTIKHLPQSALAEITLPIPPLAEQKRIVAKVDALSAKSTRARTELLRIGILVSRYKQAVLSKAFSGELTAAGASEREYSGANPMAPIYPVHWKVMQLGGIADIKSGITLGKKRNTDELLMELPYLRVANVQRGWLNLDQIKTVQVTTKEAEALYLQEGDVLMNEGGDRDKLGRGWVWEGQIPDCIHQNHVFRVRLAPGSVPSRFLSYYTNEFGQKHFFDEGKQTTNLASISKSKLSAMQIPVPPFDEATEIVRRIESAFSKIDRLAIEAKRALKLVGKLDESILAKAFRGELVPQDENDEPADKLLERIRAERDATPTAKARAGQKQA